jgi:hypothetical protein
VKGGAFPVVTALESHSIDQITFTGTNFKTKADGYTTTVYYGGAKADTVTVRSATDVRAVWDHGLPPLGEEIVPVLYFDKTGTSVRHYASITAKIEKKLDIKSAT